MNQCFRTADNRFLWPPGLLPLLIRLLFPKLRKRSGRLGGKGAPGSARAAILNFLAALEPLELRPLLELFMEPLGAAIHRVDEPSTATGNGTLAPSHPAPGSPNKRRKLDVEGTSQKVVAAGAAAAEDVSDFDQHRLLQPPWWAAQLGTAPMTWWLRAVSQESIAAQPARRKMGLLNVIEDLMGHLGYRSAVAVIALSL